MKRLAILLSIVFALAIASTASAQWVRVYRVHHHFRHYYRPAVFVGGYVPYYPPPPVAYYPAPYYGGVSVGFGFTFGGHFHHRF